MNYQPCRRLLRALPRLVPTALLALLLLSPACAATLTVPAQYATIQAGVNAAQNGDTVLVAAGTYSGPGNRDIDFGGKNLTVTSVNGPATTIIDCGGFYSSDGSGNHRGFYLHSGETNATISGFTVKNGYETPITTITDSITGGGIYTDNTGSGTITVSNCTVTGNTAAEGGGIENDTVSGNGTTTVTNCTVTKNTVSGFGGGISSYGSSGIITVTGCIFSDNSAIQGGGLGNENYSGAITLTNCTFSSNSAIQGGGIYSGNGHTMTLTNCIISSNTAQNSGGGIYTFSGIVTSSMVTLTNCTVSNNTAPIGAGIGNVDTSIYLSNCIVYGDSSSEITNASSGYPPYTINATYCDIQGGYAGTGNINADPQFVNTATGDLHLKPTSPCLGAGTATGAPTTDKDGVIRPNPPSIGAYEETPTHLLWNNTSGAASIWNYSTTNGTFTQNTYGPYANWSARAIADGGTDGQTRVLWDNADGRLSLWSLDNTSGAFSQYTFGPYAGWTANAVSVGSDNTTHILWDNGNTASIWNYNTTGGTFTQNTYGPYAGWSAKAIADGSDGALRVLWDNADGRASLWSLNNTTGAFSQGTFGPYTNWTANALSVGPDNTAHILWGNGNTASIWNYSTTSGTFTQNTYGPYPGWTANGIADGPDGKARVLWDNADGRASLWSLDNAARVFNQFTFGPYGGGWTAAGISAGM